MSKKSNAPWETTRELDRIALPLIETLGVEEAYRQATEQLGLPDRPKMQGKTVDVRD